MYLSLIIILFITSKSDFVPLFNGKNLDGWELENGKALFNLEDGVIIGTYTSGTLNTFQCTRESYFDFIFAFEAHLGEETN
ncbi:family 16 glycoside hydrolase [Maribacter sp.]|uniref:family 16 glycoside hydrolase n=1 Tax=Maribacter sp. TaxID=1897614 RepID=UPI0025C5114F|nr:family 16 glycoside hydrolase [Maribacter sp.]